MKEENFMPLKVIGTSDHIKEVYEKAIQLAQTDSTILIQGETGVGKGLIARVIHYHSPRRTKPFITATCGATNPELLDSEIFGHEKGAFTGAHQQRIGKFELANEGTIFIDEIGNACEKVQIKLLRVLDEKIIERVGSEKAIKVDVRIIVATNRDLMGAVKGGNFREDLYYRLNVILLSIPPLRGRREDIEPLLNYFLRIYNKRMREKRPRFSPKAIKFLKQYSWPGNVRELKNCMEKVVAMSKGEPVEAEDLFGSVNKLQGSEILEPLEETENRQIVVALIKSRWDLSQASTILGIHRNTLSSRLKRINVDKELSQLLPYQLLRIIELQREHIRKALEISKGSKKRAARLLKISPATLSRMMAKLEMAETGGKNQNASPWTAPLELDT